MKRKQRETEGLSDRAEVRRRVNRRMGAATAERSVRCISLSDAVWSLLTAAVVVLSAISTCCVWLLHFVSM